MAKRTWILAGVGVAAALGIAYYVSQRGQASGGGGGGGGGAPTCDPCGEWDAGCGPRPAIACPVQPASTYSGTGGIDGGPGSSNQPGSYTPSTLSQEFTKPSGAPLGSTLTQKAAVGGAYVGSSPSTVSKRPSPRGVYYQ